MSPEVAWTPCVGWIVGSFCKSVVQAGCSVATHLQPGMQCVGWELDFSNTFTEQVLASGRLMVSTLWRAPDSSWEGGLNLWICNKPRHSRISNPPELPRKLAGRAPAKLFFFSSSSFFFGSVLEKGEIIVHSGKGVCFHGFWLGTGRCPLF